MATLEEAMLERLALSGLTREHAKKLKIKAITAAEATNLGFGTRTTPAQDGFLIPYFDLKGKLTKFQRLRNLNPVKNSFTGKSGPKYLQLPGVSNQLYLPPFLPKTWSEYANRTEDAPIYITEGELKAACATVNGIPTIGLGGVWNWRNGNHRPLEILEQFNWQSRPVFICYDSDAVLNWQVQQAQNALAQALLNLGAEPHIVRIPQLNPNEKTGMDDFIVAQGADAFLALDAASYTGSEDLHRLNEEVIYVRNPGIVFRFENRQHLSPNAFVQHAYANRKYTIMVPTGNGERAKEVSAAQAWIEWPYRSEVRELTYSPGGGEIINGALNTWAGWGCQPQKGNVQPWIDFLKYLFPNKEERTYAEQWIAYPLQHPGTKLFTSMVIWGRYQGTGKSLLGYTMEKIYGKNFSEIGEADLAGSFNDWAASKQFIMGDEIASGEKRQQADRMKSIITQRYVRINQKYVPAYTIPDCINYYFTSNHPDAFFMEDTDRRFFIQELTSPPQPKAFYDTYCAWLNGDGAAALFYHLLNLDLTGFSPTSPALMTTAKQEMLEMSRSELGAWVAELRRNPDACLRLGTGIVKHTMVTASELHHFYDPTESNRRVTTQTISKEMKRQGFLRVWVRIGEDTKKLWVVRNATEIAQLWQAGKTKDIATLYRDERTAAAPKF